MESYNDELPDGWVKRESKTRTGAVFYWNIRTKESTWIHPFAEDRSFTLSKGHSRRHSIEHDELRKDVKNPLKERMQNRNRSESSNSLDPDSAKKPKVEPLMSIDTALKSKHNHRTSSTLSNGSANLVPLVVGGGVHKTSSKNTSSLQKKISSGISLKDLQELAKTSTDINNVLIKDKEKRINMAVRSSKTKPHTSSKSASNSPKNVADHSEDMEVDSNETYMMNEIALAVDKFREDTDVQMLLSEDDKRPVRPRSVNSTRSYTEKLYIVVDTNVLLGQLDYVSSLKDTSFSSLGKPVLIIPWMVMKELDSLKGSSSKVHTDQRNKNKVQPVNSLARRAINLLHSFFKEKHPCVRGQTVMEANILIPGFQKDSNDDCILHCCLVIKEKATEGIVTLLSHDKNLCNNAMIHGIQTFQKDNLKKGLEELPRSPRHLSPDINGKPTTTATDHESLHQSKKAKPESLSSQIRKGSTEVMCLLQSALKAIIEAEMERVYEDVWMDVVVVKPPWTLQNLIHLIKKHWIAVFRLAASATLKDSVTELRDYLNKNSQFKTIQDFETLSGKVLDICSAFSVNPSYSALINCCSDEVTAALERVLTAANVKSPISSPILSPNTSPPKPSNYAAMPPQAPPQISMDVKGVFDEIWKNMRKCSGEIVSSLGLQNSELAPSMEHHGPSEAAGMLLELLGLFEPLICSMEYLASIPFEQAKSDPGPFDILKQCIAAILIKLPQPILAPSIESLYFFCVEKETRLIFIQGISQFQQWLNLMKECKQVIRLRGLI